VRRLHVRELRVRPRFVRLGVCRQLRSVPCASQTFWELRRSRCHEQRLLKQQELTALDPTHRDQRVAEPGT
jgi:hypothetical protein